MKIIIIFPKEYFISQQIEKLSQYDLKFVQGKNIDLTKLEDLYEGGDFVLALNPIYVKDEWNCLPIERIKKMKNPKAICLTTTSYSWIDTKELAKMSIIVTNAPGKSTNAVAEFNIMMMFSLLRKIPLIIKNDWKMDYDRFLNKEVKGLTAGIVGLGQIGTRVAELCHGLGMRVCYWNRSKKKVPFKSVSLERLFEKADVIFTTIATPPELTGFINKKLISKMKKTAIIISTSDTHIFVERFILNQVAKGNLGGYAFESNERKLTEYRGNVMVFPEQAFYTLETQRNTARIVTESILSVISGKPINKVN